MKFIREWVYMVRSDEAKFSLEITFSSHCDIGWQIMKFVGSLYTVWKCIN